MMHLLQHSWLQPVRIHVIGYEKRLQMRAWLLYHVTMVPQWRSSADKHGVTRADAVYVMLSPDLDRRAG